MPEDVSEEMSDLYAEDLLEEMLRWGSLEVKSFSQPVSVRFSLAFPFCFSLPFPGLACSACSSFLKTPKRIGVPFRIFSIAQLVK